MLAGFAVMFGANFHIGDTAAGAALVFAGLAAYVYGWRGVCPACQAGRCDLQPPIDVVKSENAGAFGGKTSSS